MISILYPLTRMRLLLDARIALLWNLSLSLSLSRCCLQGAHLSAPLHQLLPYRPHVVSLVLCCCINESTIAVVVIVASSSQRRRSSYCHSPSPVVPPRSIAIILLLLYCYCYNPYLYMRPIPRASFSPRKQACSP